MENVCNPPEIGTKQFVVTFIDGAEAVNGADFILDVDVEFVVLLDEDPDW